MEKAIVCLRCIGDRRLYKATSTQPPALGEQCSRCGEKATLDLEVRRSSLSKVRALSREGTVHSTSRAIPNRLPSAVDQTLRAQQGAFEHNVP